MQGGRSTEEGTPPSAWQKGGGQSSLNKGGNKWIELGRGLLIIWEE